MSLLDYIQCAVLDRLLYATITIFFSLLPFSLFLTNSLLPTGQAFVKDGNRIDKKRKRLILFYPLFILIRLPCTVKPIIFILYT